MSSLTSQSGKSGMVIAGAGMWALFEELAYLQPYATVIAADYGLYLAAYGGMALATQAAWGR